MRGTTLDELACIHDCTLIDIHFQRMHDDGPNLTLAMHAPDALGHEAWAGKDILLTVVGIWASVHTVWGTSGSEMVDSITAGVSKIFQDSTVKSRQAGWFFPKLELRIAFTSGSSLEIFCDELLISE